MRILFVFFSVFFSSSLALGSGQQHGLKVLFKAGNLSQNSGLQTLLLSAAVENDKSDKHGITILHRLIRDGNILEVKNLLNHENKETLKTFVNKADEWGETPLHAAARKGNTKMIQLLVAAGADVNAKDQDDKTPLYIAKKKDHKDAVTFIEEHLERENCNRLEAIRLQRMKYLYPLAGLAVVSASILSYKAYDHITKEKEVNDDYLPLQYEMIDDIYLYGDMRDLSL